MEFPLNFKRRKTWIINTWNIHNVYLVPSKILTGIVQIVKKAFYFGLVSMPFFILKYTRWLRKEKIRHDVLLQNDYSMWKVLPFLNLTSETFIKFVILWKPLSLVLIVNLKVEQLVMWNVSSAYTWKIECKNY